MSTKFLIKYIKIINNMRLISIIHYWEFTIASCNFELEFIIVTITLEQKVKIDSYKLIAEENKKGIK